VFTGPGRQQGSWSRQSGQVCVVPRRDWLARVDSSIFLSRIDTRSDDSRGCCHWQSDDRRFFGSRNDPFGGRCCWPGPKAGRCGGKCRWCCDESSPSQPISYDSDRRQSPACIGRGQRSNAVKIAMNPEKAAQEPAKTALTLRSATNSLRTLFSIFSITPAPPPPAAPKVPDCGGTSCR